MTEPLRVGGPATRLATGAGAGHWPRIGRIVNRSSLILVLCATLSLPAVAQRRVSDGILVTPTSVATEQSVSSILVNPAGIGLGAAGLGYLHEDGDQSFADARRGDALVARLGGQVLGETAAAGLSLGVEWLRPRGVACTAGLPCVRRTSLGVSGGTSALSLGVAWRSFKSGESAELDALDTFDAGLMVRPASWLSIGAVADTLNAPTVDGVHQARRYTLGVGLRPVGTRLTLATDATVDEDAGFDEVKLGALARLTVIEGLDLLAKVSPQRQPTGGWQTDLQFGLELGLGKASLRGALSRPGGGDFLDASVVAADLTAVSGPSLGGPPMEAHVVDIARAIDPPRGLLSLLLDRSEALDPYTRLVLRLQRLGPDDGAAAVVLVMREGMGLSLGRAEELRRLVQGLRARGTRVVAWMASADDAAYYLATACDQVLASPQAMLQINGLSSNRFYLAGLFGKLGVNAEFVKIGRFKSAPEQYTDTHASEGAVEQTDAILDDQFARYVAAVAQARGLSEAKVRELLEAGAWLSEEAVEQGLIDAVVAPGPALDKQVALVAGRRLRQRPAGPDDRAPQSWGTRPAIGIVEVTGSIMGGSGLPGEKGGARQVVERLRQAARDPSVKAIVLRVDSPGGEVTASELIWAAVEEAKKRKPVVASFGDVAASGGYYVAVGADAIFAEAGTLTGSIGVFAGKADLSGLYDKLGVTTEAFKRGSRADLFTTTRPWSDAEKARIGEIVQGFYESFLQRVATGRKMSRDAVHQVAQGRVWTGAQAKDRGLVDELGGLEQALADARRRAGLPSDSPVRIFGEPGLYDLPDLRPAPRSQAVLAALELLAGALGGQANAADLVGHAQWAPVLEGLLDGRPMALAVDLPAVR